ELLIELLRSIETAATRTIQGLFGELLVLESGSDTEFLVRAWRARDPERFDFAYESERLEVKTSARGARIHHFSYEQVVDPSLRIAVGSISVEAVGAGISIPEVVDRVRSRLRT